VLVQRLQSLQLMTAPEMTRAECGSICSADMECDRFPGRCFVYIPLAKQYKNSSGLLLQQFQFNYHSYSQQPAAISKLKITQMSSSVVSR
jgi:hypothetical protein